MPTVKYLREQKIFSLWGKMKREATKKKQEKKFTTVVNYLQKWRTPPPLN